MATPVDSANLILKLYELRREPTMREARNFMVRLQSEHRLEEYMAAMMGPHSAHIRMVTLLLGNGLLVRSERRHRCRTCSTTPNGEHIIVFAKIEPFLPQLREAMGSPNMLQESGAGLSHRSRRHRTGCMTDGAISQFRRDSNGYVERRQAGQFCIVASSYPLPPAKAPVSRRCAGGEPWRTARRSPSAAPPTHPIPSMAGFVSFPSRAQN